MKKFSLFLATLLVLIPLAAMAVPVNSGNVDAELIAEVASVQPGQDFTVLLKQDIRPGWHTYWRNPGDSGAPTELSWQLPEGFSAAAIEWPYPDRVPYGPLMNFGYHDEVLFLVQISVPEKINTDSIVLKATGDWLVCADICIPESANLSLELPVGPASINRANTDLFARAREKIPRKMEFTSSFKVEDESFTLFVELQGLEKSRIESVSYFPYSEGVMENPEPQVLKLVDGGFTLSTRTGYDYQANSSFDGIILIAEVIDETQQEAPLMLAFEITPDAGTAGADVSEMSFLWAVVFAFLGGLILNLMPCVFPVLSIKILSLMQQTDNIRTHGWVYLIGVVLSFVAISAVLITLRASGAEIGWGFQLQSPWVVALLAYLFLLIGLNLAGYFEIGAGVMNLGQGLSQSSGYAGSFFTGILATVVAAPCTAPFMASAIGYALTLSNVNAMLIFASLGFGMALPYLLLCYSPGLLKRLPKPGLWMEKVKEFLSFPMFASAIWLTWVLSIQTGPEGVLALGMGVLALAFAIWLLKNLSSARYLRPVSQLLALSFVAVALYLPFGLHVNSVSADVKSDASYNGPIFQDYSEQRLASLLQQGPVFVNFDAAWCITCKVNEALALNNSAVKAAFTASGIQYLKGDWTNEDPEITRKLTEYGRSGVPLYLLYKDSSSRAQILPQLLTQEIILRAIDGL